MGKFVVKLYENLYKENERGVLRYEDRYKMIENYNRTEFSALSRLEFIGNDEVIEINITPTDRRLNWLDILGGNVLYPEFTASLLLCQAEEKIKYLRREVDNCESYHCVREKLSNAVDVLNNMKKLDGANAGSLIRRVWEIELTIDLGDTHRREIDKPKSEFGLGWFKNKAKVFIDTESDFIEENRFKNLVYKATD